jgi:hypothetical protein
VIHRVIRADAQIFSGARFRPVIDASMARAAPMTSVTTRPAGSTDQWPDDAAPEAIVAVRVPSLRMLMLSIGLAQSPMAASRSASSLSR